MACHQGLSDRIGIRIEDATLEDLVIGGPVFGPC